MTEKQYGLINALMKELNIDEDDIMADFDLEYDTLKEVPPEKASDIIDELIKRRRENI